jgi:hypothetical protein
MPHPTPYSRQFDAIRSAYPALFERPGSESRPLVHGGGIKATTDSRDGCEQTKPEGK